MRVPLQMAKLALDCKLPSLVKSSIVLANNGVAVVTIGGMDYQGELSLALSSYGDDWVDTKAPAAAASAASDGKSRSKSKRQEKPSAGGSSVPPELSSADSRTFEVCKLCRCVACVTLCGRWLTHLRAALDPQAPVAYLPLNEALTSEACDGKVGVCRVLSTRALSCAHTGTQRRTPELSAHLHRHASVWIQVIILDAVGEFIPRCEAAVQLGAIALVLSVHTQDMFQPLRLRHVRLDAPSSELAPVPSAAAQNMLDPAAVPTFVPPEVARR